MFDPASPLAALLASPMRPGTVMWIGVRPARRQPLSAVPEAQLDPEEGLVGDHYRNRTTRTRQVTLIAREHIAAIASYLGLETIEPARLRRNIVVSGMNLLALKGARLRLGTALVEVMGECHPCSRMEQEFGPGGYNAVRGHGGLTARVVEAGTVRAGEGVTREDWR